MKTFKAEEFNKSPQRVYRAADIDGSVRINHERYPDVIFVLEARNRGVSDKERAIDNIKQLKMLQQPELRFIKLPSEVYDAVAVEASMDASAATGQFELWGVTVIRELN